MLACQVHSWWSWPSLSLPKQKDDDFSELELVLYTSGSNPMKFKIDDDNLSQKFLNHGFDEGKETKLFAHGFQDDGARFCADFISAYVSSGWNVNLVCIDWEEYADNDPYLYIRASNNAIKIGRKIGGKIISNLLIEDLNQNPNLIHAIGHSLGAHLVGNIGKNSGNQKIGRITGLDPARPYFENYADSKERLLKEDADFVDVIHTNSGDLHEGCLSMPWSMGHVDFYPNGGQHMPGCVDPSPSNWNIFRNFYSTVSSMVTACSHNKVLHYYSESIKHRSDNKYFLSKNCGSFSSFEKNLCQDGDELPMGEALTASMVQSEGKYYLETGSTSPFNLP